MQAALLPKLARLAGAGRDDEFRSSFRQLVLIVVGVGAVGVVGGFAAGHAVGQLLFGTKFTLSNRDVGLLAVGSGAFILALTLAQALIALRSYAAATWSWVVGAAGAVAGAFAAQELILRSELSYAIGCSAAAVAMGSASPSGCARHPGRHDGAPHDGSRARTTRDLDREHADRSEPRSRGSAERRSSDSSA